MAFDIEILDSLDGMWALESEWREVWRRDAAATPFEGPDWLLPWTKWLWGGGRLRTLALRRAGRLAAVAPFFLWGYGSEPEIVRLSLLGSGITDHLGITADPQFELDAARAIFGRPADTAGEWHVCDLEELSPGSPLLRVETPEGLTPRDAPCGVCPVLALPGTWDELLAGLDAKFRRNLRVAESRLEKQGAEFAAVPPEQWGDAVQALIRLHEARWRERRETGMLATPLPPRRRAGARARGARPHVHAADRGRDRGLRDRVRRRGATGAALHGAQRGSGRHGAFAVPSRGLPRVPVRVLRYGRRGARR